MSDVQEAFDRAYAGGPERHRAKAAEQGKLPVRERVARLLDPGSFTEDALLANWEAEGLGADGVVTGMGTIGGRTVALMANDPTVKAGSWGPEDGREDPAHPGGRARAPRADGLPRRLGGRADHRAGADVPRPPPRRPDLLPRGPALGRRAAGLRAVRPERRGRRVHPRLLRRRDHARRERLDVPRLAADGRDGHRRARLARGDGRRQDAHRRLGLRALPRQDRRGGHRPRQALPVLLPLALGGGPARRAARAGEGGRDADPRADPGGREQAVGHARADRRARRRGVVPRGPQALGEGAHHRLRAARRPRRRPRRQPAEVQGRRALRRLRRQGRALHLDLQRLRHPAAVPRRRPRLHDRHRGGAPGHHPPRREDDLGGERGDRAQALRGGAQGLRRRPVRDGRPRLRARRVHRAADGEDRGDGAERGGQRRLLQPARGDRGRGGARPRAAPS